MLQALSRAFLGALAVPFFFLPLVLYSPAAPSFAGETDGSFAERACAVAYDLGRIDGELDCLELEELDPTTLAPLASKVFGFTATGYSTSATTPADSCGSGNCLYDGTTDYGGTSGATENEDDDDQVDTHTISGAAVNAWEGSGSISLEVVLDYNGSGSSGTGGWAAGLHSFLAGYSLDVSYNASGGGTTTYTRQSHPSGSPWVWTFTVPEYNGQLSSIDFELQVLSDCTVGVESLNPTTCAQASFEFHTSIDAELWRL